MTEDRPKIPTDVIEAYAKSRNPNWERFGDRRKQALMYRSLVDLEKAYPFVRIALEREA